MFTRRFQPSLEGCEQRQLLSAGMIGGSGFLQGTAFADLNNDGAFDTGDSPLANARVSLYGYDANSQTSTFLKSVTTGSTGTYLFQNLAPGEYHIVETPAAGFSNSGTAANWSLGTASGLNPSTIDVQLADNSKPIYVNFLGVGPNMENVISIQGPNNPLAFFQTLIGEISASLGSQPGQSDINAGIAAYCGDLYGDIDYSDTGFQIVPLSQSGLPGNTAAVAYLMNAYQPTLHNEWVDANNTGNAAELAQVNLDAEALQFAIWEYTYEPTPDPTLANPRDPIGVAYPPDKAPLIAQLDYYLNDAANAVAGGLAQDETAMSLAATQPDKFQSLVAGGSLSFANVPNTGNTISGFKFNDLNDSGQYLPGEPGVGGVTIQLSQNGVTVATTQTTTDGTYSFPNLAPGTYTVRENVPNGWTQTFGGSDNGGYDVTIPAGQTNDHVSNQNFGNYYGGVAQTLNLTGTAFHDVTVNGFSNDDTAFPSVYVDLSGFTTDGTLVWMTTQTDPNGNYSFNNLAPGTYTVQQETAPGYALTGGSAGYRVSYYNGVLDQVDSLSQSAGSISYPVIVQTSQNVQTAENLNFDNAQLPAVPNSISGSTYRDPSGSGLSDPNYQTDDPLMVGIEVNLYLNGGSTPIATTITDGAGNYSFTNLASGTYTVQEVVPFDWSETGGAAGHTVTLVSGTNAVQQDFTNYLAPAVLPGSISGTVYADLTNNGLSNDDSALSGVTVNLLSNGALIASLVTDNQGKFDFTGLIPGTYSVQEVVPAGDTLTGGPAAGYTTAVASGQDVTGDNFDNFVPVSIKGLVYNDTNGNGLLESGESGIGGGSVTLTGTTGAGAITPITIPVAANGTYSFTGLLPGSYTVTETTLPSGYTATGSDIGTPSGSSVSATVIAAISLNPGQNAISENFGVQQASDSISGLVYNDPNGNGVLDRGEGGITGGTVTLTGKNAGGAITPITIPVAANGTYSFSGLQPGTYTVTETTLPTGYLPTGSDAGSPNGTSTSATVIGSITLVGAQNATAENFGVISLATCPCGLTGITYSVTPPGGGTPVKVTDLRGNTQQGETVTATFTVPAGQAVQLSLVSYNAPESFYNANDASLQTVYQQNTATYLPGTHSVSVVLPSNFYQVDFVCGQVITKLGPAGSNNFYSAQNRLISADNGGLNPLGQSPISITGTVYCDANNNGVLNSSDGLLSGVSVSLTGTDAYGNSITASAITNAQGVYTITGLPVSNSAGYTVTVATPSGDWSGKATVGSAHGTAVTTPEAVSGIVLGTNASNGSGTGYNFGILMPSTIAGTVYADATDNGVINSGDKLLSGVTVTLTGTNDQGTAVTLSTKTDASGNYSFTGLRQGTYTLTETLPSGYVAGKNTIGQINGATATGVTISSSPDAIKTVSLGYGAAGTSFNFADLTSCSAVCAGQTATIGFWNNKNGQALINAFNGGGSSTALAQWLCTSFSNLYSCALSKTTNGQTTYATNAQVASYYNTLFNAGGQKTTAQVMCMALGVYASTQSLGGATGSSYGFAITANGLGASTYNVGSNGAAFGVANNITLTVFQLLNSINSQASAGALYSGSSSQSSYTNAANTVVNGINTQGDI